MNKASINILNRAIEQNRSLDIADLKLIKRDFAQLEADLKRHEDKIKYYPDSYLGKIFLQGVEHGRRKLEAKNELLREAIKQDHDEGKIEVDKALHEFGYDSLRFADVRHGWIFSTRHGQKAIGGEIVKS